MRALVIEDDPKIAEFMRRGLEAEGYPTDVARDGRSGHQRTGLGLGLALSRAIARCHGGDITAVHGAGAGACLRLSLPGHRVDPEDPMADRSIPVTPASGRWAGTCG